MTYRLFLSGILLMFCLVLNAQFSSSVLIDRNVELDNSWKMCDFNNDGLLDIFSTSNFIHYQNEQGTVGTATELNGMLRIVDVGDIDGDGVYEIFATNRSGDFYLNLNDGSGIFTPILLTNYIPDGVKLGDFDGNGLTDILIYGGGSDVVKFQTTVGGSDYSTVTVFGPNPKDHRDKPTVIYDSDNDGKDELWYYNLFSNTIFRTAYQLDGSLSRTEIMTPNQVISAFSIGDIDLDGIDELILRQFGSDLKFYLHRKLNNGLFNSIPYEEFTFQAEGLGSGNVTVLDIDNDNLPDLVGGSGDIQFPFSFTISAYLKNRGNSLFTEEILYDQGRIADINSDGEFDLILSESSQRANKIYNYFEHQEKIQVNGEFNNSTFLRHQYVDIDNDENIDLLGIHENRISWYENNDGTGNFGTEQIIGDLSETYDDHKIATEDFNNDGTVDIITRNSSGTFSLFNNVGGEDNLFPISEKYDLNISNDDVINLIADQFTPDDFPDLLANQDGNIVIARNDPNFNAFTPWATLLSKDILTTGSNYFTSFEVIKIEGDFGRGIVAHNRDQLFFTSMTGSPLQLSAPIELRVQDQELSHLDAKVGDIDGDGDDDIVAFTDIGIGEGTQLYWWEQIQSSGVFTDGQLLIPNAFDNPTFSNGLSGKLRLVDINNDNKLDIIGSNWIYIQVNNFEFAKEIIIDIDGFIPLIFLDLNGDDRPEIIKNGEWWDNEKIAQDGSTFFNFVRNDSNISIWDMNEDGTLDIHKSATEYHSNQIINETPNFTTNYIESGYSLSDENAVIDIDGDGRENLISATSFDRTINWFKGVSYFNNPIPTSLPIGGTNPLYADMDNDGDIDIVSTKPSTNSSGTNGTGLIGWQENINNWNMEDIISDQAGFPFFNKALGDFNNDSFLDLVTVKEFGIYLLINQQGNGFGDPNLIYQGDFDINTSIGELLINDLDNDGKLDISFQHYFSENIIILFQEEGTNFQEANYPASRDNNVRFNSYLTGDLNQDQLTDLIYNDDEKLMVYFQTAPRTFAPVVQHYELTKSIDDEFPLYSFKLEDLDYDSDIDLIYKINYAAQSNITRIVTELYWAENVLNSNQISGEIFFDENQNGIRDTLEQGLQNISPELSPEGLYTYSEPNGTYAFYLSPGEYDLAYQDNPLWNLASAAPNYDISIPSDTVISQSGFDFGFYPNIDLPNITPTITSGITRCNTTVRFFVEGINQGTQINSGTLSFVKASDAEVDSFDISPDIQIGLDTFIWNINDLYPSQKITRKVFLRMPNESSTWDEIPFQAITSFQNVTTDTTISTIYEYNPVLRCSYDPNDKLVYPDRPGEENYALFEESLEYTIRFQNTGNDTAFNIVIRDTLDPNLNWNTFRPLSSSHPYTLTRNDQGVLAFDFRNIMLPDSNVNFISSQGFIKFLIDPNEGLSENTVIENTAYIYFDFNVPIITNTIINTMVSELQTTSIKIVDGQVFPTISLFPNPSNGIFNFVIPNEIPLPLKLRILDPYGREIHQQMITDNREIKYQNSTYPSSIFFYQFLNTDRELLQSGKLIKH